MLQSASSWLPILSMDIKQCERILDLCGAPGGKSCHIASKLKNTGLLWVNE